MSTRKKYTLSYQGEKNRRLPVRRPTENRVVKRVIQCSPCTFVKPLDCFFDRSNVFARCRRRSGIKKRTERNGVCTNIYTNAKHRRRRCTRVVTGTTQYQTRGFGPARRGEQTCARPIISLFSRVPRRMPTCVGDYVVDAAARYHSLERTGVQRAAGTAPPSARVITTKRARARR